MQFIQKYILTISVAVLLIIAAYFTVQDILSSQSDEISRNTTIIQDTLPQSDTGIETNTGKSLSTVTQSGTGWQMSPFGSGKPLTEDEKKPVFQKPNTEWKSRSITLSDGRTLYYEFGKGNPEGVAMTLEQIKEINKICKDGTNPVAQKLINAQICNQESGLIAYVTPEVEKYFLAALSDPNWSKLVTECEKNFKSIENADTLINSQNDSEYPLFDRVFLPGWLDMDRYLYIDPNTGLKLLYGGRINILAEFLTTASHYGQRKNDGWINPYGDCVDRYGTEIARNLYSALELYKNPLAYINGYTNQFILSDNFTLSQF